MTLIGALVTGLASWYLLLIPVIWFFQVLGLLGADLDPLADEHRVARPDAVDRDRC